MRVKRVRVRVSINIPLSMPSLLAVETDDERRPRTLLSIKSSQNAIYVQRKQRRGGGAVRDYEGEGDGQGVMVRGEGKTSQGR